MKVIDSLVTQAPNIAAIRRDIHAHPELCFQEERTSDLVARTLHRLMHGDGDGPWGSLRHRFHSQPESPR